MHTSTSTIRRAPIVLTVLLPIVMLATPTIPAWADAADPAPIHMASSVRSFPKHPVPHRSVNLPDLTVGASVPFAEMIASGMAT